MVEAFFEVTHIGDRLPFWTCVCWEVKPISLADKFHSCDWWTINLLPYYWTACYNIVIYDCIILP